MESSNPRLLQEDRLSSVRRRNKILIISFFSLIILLALITGGIIVSVVQKFNSDSVDSNPAIREFCGPFGLQSSCVTLLSSEIKAPYDATPNRIFILSLESSLRKISNVMSILSDGTRPESALRNCSNSLSDATGQLNNILEIMRIDSDVETYDRGNMTAWMTAAAEDVAACVGDLGKAESAVMIEVVEVAALLGYGRDFRAYRETVNENFRWVYAGERRPWDEIVENLITVSLFGSQYFVLVLLFCLFLRI